MNRPNVQTSSVCSSDFFVFTIRRFDVWAAITVLAVLVALGPFGCVTDEVVTSDGRAMPKKPVAPPPPPADAHATRMAFMVGSKPEDTTGDGFPDMIHATVALFISEARPQAIRQQGTFEFVLYRRGEMNEPGAEPIAEWQFSGEEVQRFEARSQYGPVYQFRLSLRDFPSHRRPLTIADLRCVFIPDDEYAPRVMSEGVRTIYIGRRERR